MRSPHARKLALSSAAVAVAAIVALNVQGAERTAANTASVAPIIATPLGITTQPLGKAQGWGLDKEGASFLPRERIAYADLKGKTLYTYDKDPVGQSTCVDECAKTWPPMPALANAMPFGDWSVIARPDGSRQWALKGKPLYTYVKDEDPGSVGGSNIAKTMGRGPNTGSRGSYHGPRLKDAPMPENWQPALLYPVSGIKMPAGFAVKEVPDSAGFVFVDDRGRTLYLFDGDPLQDGQDCMAASCSPTWMPLAAATIAHPVGDFAVISRGDGIRQWTYKGRGLYAYAGDLAAGDANGIGVDKRWSVAQLVRYYMPDSVTIVQTAALGKVLATAAGKTLYRRDGWLNQSGGGHSFVRGQPARPAVGRDIGTNPRCNDTERFDSTEDAQAAEDCYKVWHPFLASAGAQPSGFWDIAVREDGKRQWIYQGYALWTYDVDKKPGDINGNDVFDWIVSENPEVPADVGTQMDGVASLFWAVTPP
jgi:predicted lipoprotein with Yx(FWY)xxD motif